MWRSFPVQTALSSPAIRSAAWRIFPMTDTDATSAPPPPSSASEAEEHVDVTHIGEPNFILTYEDPRQKNTWISWCKTILVGILTFIGTAFSIMTFHTDIGVRELFLDVYTRFLPQMTPGFSVLEISYSIGIGLGVVLYFNHFGRRKFTQDPTPLEVEMRVYEDDIDTTILEQNDRSGKGKEAFHANPARDPAGHGRS